jgi:hypothetical protein
MSVELTFVLDPSYAPAKGYVDRIKRDGIEKADPTPVPKWPVRAMPGANVGSRVGSEEAADVLVFEDRSSGSPNMMYPDEVEFREALEDPTCYLKVLPNDERNSPCMIQASNGKFRFKVSRSKGTVTVAFSAMAPMIIRSSQELLEFRDLAGRKVEIIPLFLHRVVPRDVAVSSWDGHRIGATGLSRIGQTDEGEACAGIFGEVK